MEYIVNGFNIFFQPVTIFATLIGTILGIIIGALPGLGAGIGMTLLLPLVFFFKPEIGLLLLTSLWMANNYGGSVSAILLNVPGTGGAIFTCLDGFPIAQQGKSLTALGLSLAASAVGGFTGVIVFILFLPVLTEFAIKLGPAELFWIAIMGITAIAATSKGELLKGLISACIGFVISFMGMDLMTGYLRFTFGNIYLISGIEFQVLIIGMFAISRLIDLLTKGPMISKTQELKGSIKEGFFNVFRYPVTLIRSSLLGAILGVLPGLGVSAATAIAYGQTVQTSKNPKTFGKGNPEGVIAPESANNAVQGGALVPTLGLGVPGSASSVVFLGALIMYGLQPGPGLFSKRPDLIGLLALGMIASIILFIIMGWLFAGLFAKITTLKLNLLVPILLIISLIGAFISNGSIFDVCLAIIFGILGLLMERSGYPIIPTLIAFALGPMTERNFFRALIISHGSYKIFFSSYISIIIILVIIFILIYPFIGLLQKSSSATYKYKKD